MATILDEDKLLTENYGWIRGVVYNLTHKKKCWGIPHGMDFEDLVQIGAFAFLLAARRHDPLQFANLHRFASYVIRFSILDEIRKWNSNYRGNRLMSETPSFCGVACLGFLESLEKAPDERAFQAIGLKHVSELCKRLPPLQASIINLRFFYDLSSDEIAAKHCIKASSVYTIQSLAIKQLRNLAFLEHGKTSNEPLPKNRTRRNGDSKGIFGHALKVSATST